AIWNRQDTGYPAHTAPARSLKGKKAPQTPAREKPRQRAGRRASTSTSASGRTAPCSIGPFSPTASERNCGAARAEAARHLPGLPRRKEALRRRCLQDDLRIRRVEAPKAGPQFAGETPGDVG